MGRRHLRGLLLLSGCVVGALGASVAPAGGADTPPPTFEAGSFPPDAGVLHLHLGAEDYLRFDETGEPAGAPQPFQPIGCLMGPQPILATFAAKSASGGNGRGNVGLIQDAIGLQARGEGNGTACGQVNGAGEQLSVKLGSGLGEYVMDFAELDIEGKFEVTVVAKLYRDGVQVGPTETLSFVGSDSGPDSGARDNQRWRVPEDPDAPPVFFDEIRLSVSSATPGGAFSLEGGADGTVPGSLGTELGTADSLFHLTTVDGTLGCGETATEGSGITEPQASITLVDEAGCEPIPYNLEVDVNDDGWQTVLLQKPDGNAHFAITLRWQPEEALYPVPATLIDYGDGRGPHAMIWCDDLDGNEATDVEPWCVTDHHATLLADGQMQLTERLLGNGDPLNAR